MFLPLYIFQEVRLSFVSAFSLCSHFFASLTAAIIIQTTIIQLRCTVVIFSDFILVLPIHFQPPLSISSDDTHHTMIGMFLSYASHLDFLTSKLVTILILDRASFFYASPSRPPLEDALDQAYSQYNSSDTHNAVKEQFLLPPKQYSISQFTEFVLPHRL
jgi:hypothetical protein